LKKIFILIGVRGSGKTTILNELKKFCEYKILNTCTTRRPRYHNEEYYNFLDLESWSDIRFAYEIKYLEIKYGLGFDELDSLSNKQVGLTVFHPLFFEKIKTIRKQLKEYEIITIGLDTIKTYEDQKIRVNNDKNRIDSVENFIKQKEYLNDCDVKIQGDKLTILNAILSITNVVVNKGVLADRDIRNIIKANSLLQNVDFKNIKSASYDLRLGDEYWENGKRKEIDDSNPAISIQPYSYIIAISKEKAYFPKFITARFDLKVSLFLDGIILSAAPQIEPGYCNGKICSLLFNASDRPVSLKKGDHYATLEFSSTSYITEGYKEQHQGQEKIAEHMEANTFKGPGSNILSRLKKLEVWKTSQIFGAITVLIFLGSIYATNLNIHFEIKSKQKEIIEMSEKIKKLLKDSKTINEKNKIIIELRNEVEILKKNLKQIEIKYEQKKEVIDNKISN